MENVIYSQNGDGTISKITNDDNTAISVGIALMTGLPGAGPSGLFGQDADAGAATAQSEATNNALGVKFVWMMIATLFGPIPMVVLIFKNDLIVWIAKQLAERS